jgi:glycosyltransferase involved in cell wall biosynthesis
MKILVNALSARKGGIVTYTNNLLNSFIERGIDIKVAVSEEFETDHTSAIIRFNVSKFSPIKRLIWEQSVWRRLVKKYDPDVLFSSANFGLLNCPVKQILLLREGGLFDPFYLANMAAPLGVRHGVSRFFRRNLMLISAVSSDYIITPTRAMQDLVSLWKPSIRSKIEVNSYGTINENFKSPPLERKWREGGFCKLLYVSVYYPHKVPYMICQAVDKLSEAELPCHATISMSPSEFVGMPGSNLDAIILSDGVERGSVTLGNHKYRSLPKLYQEHDIFIFPSVSETFGHPMAEAMSSGLPVVAADTPVNREICGNAALYFEPFSVLMLMERIKQLDQDEGLRKSLIKNWTCTCLKII